MRHSACASPLGFAASGVGFPTFSESIVSCSQISLLQQAVCGRHINHPGWEKQQVNLVTIMRKRERRKRIGEPRIFYMGPDKTLHLRQDRAYLCS